MKKLLFFSALLLTLSACQLEPTPVTEVVPEHITLTGAYLCLPHTDPSEFETMECTHGMQTEDGTYYAVDFALSSQMGIEPDLGETFTASGIVTPVEMLSSDHWRNYPIEGIFSVTNRTL